VRPRVAAPATQQHKCCTDKCCRGKAPHTHESSVHRFGRARAALKIAAARRRFPMADVASPVGEWSIHLSSILQSKQPPLLRVKNRHPRTPWRPSVPLHRLRLPKANRRAIKFPVGVEPSSVLSSWPLCDWAINTRQRFWLEQAWSPVRTAFNDCEALASASRENACVEFQYRFQFASDRVAAQASIFGSLRGIIMILNIARARRHGDDPRKSSTGQKREHGRQRRI